jgi:FtsH-binding integral membrane protein
MSYPEKTRSNMWFLVPIFFGMIGGIIAYLIIRKDDPQKAKKCIYVGIIMVILGIILNISLASEVSTLHPGFNVNI